MINIIIMLILLAMCILSVYVAIHSYCEMRKAQNMLYEQRQEWLVVKSKLSMIEKYCRDYTEGKNGFTELRNIGNIVHDGSGDLWELGIK